MFKHLKNLNLSRVFLVGALGVAALATVGTLTNLYIRMESQIKALEKTVSQLTEKDIPSLAISRDVLSAQVSIVGEDLDDLYNTISDNVVLPGYSPDTDLSLVKEVDSFVEKTCAYHEFADPYVVRGMIFIESGYDPDKVSPHGCVGLMQVSPTYHTERAERLGVTNLSDIYGNLVVGIDYFDELIKTCGSVELALMYYNMGPSAAQKTWDTVGETMYVRKVLAKANEFRNEG